MKRKSVIVLILISISLLSFAWNIRTAHAQGFTDDFSTDMWTHFSGDSTYDSYVDTSVGVLRFYSEASDRDFSYRQIASADNVTVEFKIRITFTQNTGVAFIGLADAPDSVGRGWAYATNTQPPSEVTRGIFLVIQGRDWTPRGQQMMYSGYVYGSGYENWTQDVSGSAGYDFALDTDYYAKITKEGGRAIVELWDASKTTLLFQKDWGNIGLPVLQYLLVSDKYIGSDEGYGWTKADQVHGYIDDLRASPSVTDGLVGCWDFDEGSLVTALDMSGNGNNGTMMNTTYSDPPPGTSSTASLFFNNTQVGDAYSYVRIPDSPSLRPNSSLTLSAWVKTNAVQSRACIIVGKQYGSYSWWDSYNIWYEWGLLNFYLKTETGELRISTAQPSTNEWHHVVATYNGSIMRLYVDGVEQTNGTLTGSIVYTDNPVSIGADSDRADHTLEQGWDGYIDEVLIYNRALNQTEIDLLFDGSPPDIDMPTQDPSVDSVQPNQNVTVSVNVTDNLSGVKNVTLVYSLDNGTTWENPALMNLNTTSNLYEGTIPGQPMGTAVRFKVVAFDNAENNVTKDGTSVDYVYIVVPELSTLIVIPLFMIAALLAVVVYRKKQLA